MYDKFTIQYLSISSLIIKVNNTLKVYNRIAVFHCYNPVPYIQFLVVLFYNILLYLGYYDIIEIIRLNT